jgi:hypothetical protein
LGALENRWNKVWHSRLEARQTKIFFPIVNKNRSRAVYQLSRQTCGRMVRYLTGHAYLKYHESLVWKTGDDRCRFCGEAREEANHLLLTCPRLTQARLDYFPYPGGTIPPEEGSKLEIPKLWGFIVRLGDLEEEGLPDFMEEY